MCFPGYSYHKQFFLFIAFASIISAPPLRKILAAPLLRSSLFSELRVQTRMIKKKAWPVLHTCHEPSALSIRELLNAVGSKAQTLLVAFQSEFCNVGSLP